MLDYARPLDQSMCEFYLPPTSPAPARLDDFQVFRKGSSYIYGNYYSTPSYEPWMEPEIESATNVYHNLVSRDYHCEDWRNKVSLDWNENDTISWILDTVQCMGNSEYDIAYYNLRVSGIELRGMKCEEIIQRLALPNVDPIMSRRIGQAIYEKLQDRINEETFRQVSLYRSELYQQHEPIQTVLDLDEYDQKSRLHASDYRPNDSSILQAACDSSDDADDMFRSSETASPECSYGSDVSKSGDEDDKRKLFKRPPGRPKGSGRKACKRPRSVSVPEFLRNLLLDPQYCPSIIKWEDYSIGKFRFVKPDDVAKLWGKMKQNESMTFEKFSRAMRYHYRQSVLVSVPTARLVYQFGHKGPDFKTDNPNFTNVKSERTMYP